MKYELVIVGTLETNCYLVYSDDSDECAIMDPGAEPEKIFAAIGQLGLKPIMILNTHGHVDHVGANSDMKGKYQVPLYLHAGDETFLKASEQSELSLFLGAKSSPPPDGFLEDGAEFKIGGTVLRVLHTPGHSPGSVSFLSGKVLFSGDTLFNDGVGRTDLPGGSWKELEKSIRDKILTLSPDTVVLPGHGPLTTVGQEAGFNPFVS